MPARLTTIQIATRTVCPIKKVGVPKKRANPSALRPNQSFPNADARWACGRRKRKWLRPEVVFAVVSVCMVAPRRALVARMSLDYAARFSTAPRLPQARALLHKARVD